jgi:hypothetical protein
LWLPLRGKDPIFDDKYQNDLRRRSGVINRAAAGHTPGKELAGRLRHSIVAVTVAVIGPVAAQKVWKSELI